MGGDTHIEANLSLNWCPSEFRAELGNNPEIAQ